MSSPAWLVAVAASLALGCAACEPASAVVARDADARPPAAEASGAGSTGAVPAFEVERSGLHAIRSTRLGRTYEVYVKTPPGYDKPENAGRRYPAIYLTDGPYTFQVASGVTRVPFNQGRLEEFILVGLSYARGEDGQASRHRDYTPYVNPGTKLPTGQAGAYLEHLEREVLPLVESRYRTDPGRRSLSGQSFGGLFGLWVAFTRPDLFSSYILTSPSIWYVQRSLLTAEADYAARHEDLKATIYLATGSLEQPGGCVTCRANMVGDQAELVRRLRARNYPGLRIREDVIDGTIHEMTYPVGLVHALQWMFYDRATGRGRVS